MKRMLREQNGVLTVEGSIVLPIFIFFIMIFLNFSQVYRAQNYIAHNLLQASSLIAAESYEKDVSALAGAGTELSEMFDNFSDMFKSSSQIQAEYTADQAKSTQALIADKMAEAAGGQSILEGNLKSFRVEDGMDFSRSTYDAGSREIHIVVEYKIAFRYPFFGIDTITLVQNAKAYLWR